MMVSERGKNKKRLAGGVNVRETEAGWWFWHQEGGGGVGVAGRMVVLVSG